MRKFIQDPSLAPATRIPTAARKKTAVSPAPVFNIPDSSSVWGLGFITQHMSGIHMAHDLMAVQVSARGGTFESVPLI